MRRDPEGRRRAIVAAAVEVIAESGTGRTTHRAIAARAGVPLGATTYYFPTLADLITAALEQVTEAARAELARWRSALPPSTAAGDVPRILARLLVSYLSGAGGSHPLLEYELYLAAARDARLRPLAEVWLDGARDLLAPWAGPAAAGVVAYLDGVMLQSVVTGRDCDATRVEQDLAALLTAPSPPVRGTGPASRGG